MGTVSASVTSEAVARSSADAALGGRIDTVTATAGTASANASSALLATNGFGARLTSVEFRQEVRANLQPNGGFSDAEFATNGLAGMPGGSVITDSPLWGRYFSTTVNGTYGTYMPPINVAAGQVYTVSFDPALFSSGGTTRLDVVFYTGSNGTGSGSFGPSTQPTGQSDFSDDSRRSLTFTTPAGTQSIRVRPVQEGITGATLVGWRRIKVERGDKATPWTDEQADNVATARIRSAEIAAAGVATRTTSLETNYGALAGRVTTTESSISTINGSLASLQTTVAAIANPTLNLVTNSTFAQGGAGWSYTGNWSPEAAP